MLWSTAAKVVRVGLGVDNTRATQLLADVREGKPLPLPTGTLYYRSDKRYECIPE